MTAPARLLAIMGSGETTPTMVKTHRELFRRLPASAGPAVLVDTPYGFQSNAADISARAVAYFRESVGQAVEVAGLARTEGADALALERGLARVGEARWLFAGPGSPTYALRQWCPTVVPQFLAEKLASGGCIVFSSAAALTLGCWTVPVYEIYKAGADPAWAEGLDLLAPAGLNVAVIPHYNNAEGGTHDTRYCYLGEGRLRYLESQLPPEAWVLGVDEHTVCTFDLSAGEVSIGGLGSVTVRCHGRSAAVPAGETLKVEELVGLAGEVGRRAGGRAGGPGSYVGGAGVAKVSRAAPCENRLAEAAPSQAALSRAMPSEGVASEGVASEAVGPEGVGTARSPLLAEVARLGAAFDGAVARRDSDAATEAALELEAVVHAWSADTFQSDELDRARAALRRMVLRLGQFAAGGLADPREVASPWAEALLVEREEARRSRRYADADRIRQSLGELGVEVRDAPAGTTWELRA
ncbi:MAG: CysS/YqeB C-terminal domain-containing protein [Acidimicrobiales bacterium]